MYNTITCWKCAILYNNLFIFGRPSASREEYPLSKEYIESEKYGARNGHCKDYQDKCSFSLLEKISRIIVIWHIC